MTRKLWLTVAAAALIGQGCTIPSAPVYGGVVTAHVKGPVTGVDNNVRPIKTGTSEATGIILASWGDASIEAAMKAGGITRVHHVESESFGVLGIYSKYRTIVYGE